MHLKNLLYTLSSVKSIQSIKDHKFQPPFFGKTREPFRWARPGQHKEIVIYAAKAFCIYK